MTVGFRIAIAASLSACRDSHMARTSQKGSNKSQMQEPFNLHDASYRGWFTGMPDALETIANRIAHLAIRIFELRIKG